MKNVLFTILSVFTLHVSAQTTYYVSTSGNDSNNNGSNAAPWKTIQFGTDQLEPGDTLRVRPGVYKEIVTLNGTSDSGTPNKPMIIKADSGVIIDGGSISPRGTKGLITLTEVSNITIEGFEIQNYQTPESVFDDTNTPIGILVRGSCNTIIIRNNIIHDIKNFSSCSQEDNCGPGANGIAVFGDTTDGIQGIELINNEVYQCVTSSSEVFTLNGNINGFKVIDNYVHDNNNIGFDFIGFESGICNACGDDNQVRNGLVKGNKAIRNTIFGNPTIGVPQNPWYISSIRKNEGNAGGFYVDGGRNIIFDGNISSQNDLGFEFGSENQFRATSDILMINNYVYSNKESGVICGGYSETEDDPEGGGGDAIRIYIYNNSFYKNKGWGSEIVFQNRVKNSRIANNIFFGEASTAACHENFNPSSNTNNIWGTNLWWGTTISGSIPGKTITENPEFADPNSGNLDLTESSLAVNAGESQEALNTWPDPFWDSFFTSGTAIPVHGTTDYRGNSRFSGTIDLGTFEFKNTLTVGETKNKPEVSIYPNPVNDIIHFSITGIKYNYSIYTIDGKRVKKGKAYDQISVSNLKKGIYLLQVEENDQRWSYKFVKN